MELILFQENQRFNPIKSWSMKTKTTIILSTMMFLQYYIWAHGINNGTFMSKYLGSTGIQIELPTVHWPLLQWYPVLCRMVADRFSQPESDGYPSYTGWSPAFPGIKNNHKRGFLLVILFYSLAYMPTIALSNSVPSGRWQISGSSFHLSGIWYSWLGYLGFMISLLVWTDSAHFLYGCNCIGSLAFTAYPAKYTTSGKHSFFCQIVMASMPGSLQGKSYLSFHCCNIRLHTLSFYLVCNLTSTSQAWEYRRKMWWADLGSPVHTGHPIPVQQDRSQENAADRNDCMDPQYLCLPTVIWCRSVDAICRNNPAWSMLWFLLVTGICTQKKSNERIKSAAQDFSLCYIRSGMFIEHGSLAL